METASDEREATKGHLGRIRDTAREIGRKVTLMEVCGGHTNVIMRYGIRDILPSNIRLISGPGCPVCVSSQRDIDCTISMAMAGIPIATYGDMLKVPGSSSSLEKVKAMGGKVLAVYSSTEVLALQGKHPGMVFFGVGFETTAPMTGFLLEHEVPVFSVHKLVPPALKSLCSGEVRIDGFIDPGHVSSIIGMEEYQEIKVPQVISGFSPEQILRSIGILLELIRDHRSITVNGYPEIVEAKGNVKARRLLARAFSIADSEWRGLGVIPSSGLEVKDDSLNAKIIHEDLLRKVPAAIRTACRCGDVIKGVIEPMQCPLYKKACTPLDPKGACMVSSEGSCAISYRYGKEAA